MQYQKYKTLNIEELEKSWRDNKENWWKKEQEWSKD